jgi:hypothetical protein
MSENKTKEEDKLEIDVYWSIFPTSIDRPTGIVIVFDKVNLKVENTHVCIGGHFLNDTEVASLERVHREIIANIMASVLVFLDFLSCKNVAADDAEIDKKLQKARVKKGKVKKQPPDLTAGEFNRREC